GKAYEMMSCFEGLAELYRITDNINYYNSLITLYENIRDQEIMIHGLGGLGDFYGEYWNDGKRNQTHTDEGRKGETCVTNTWFKFGSHILRLKGDSRVADQMEITMYNALIGAMRPDGEWWTHQNPTLVTGDMYNYKKNAGVQFIGQDCCVASGPMALAMIPQYAVMKKKDSGPVINFYEEGAAKVNLDSCEDEYVDLGIIGDYPKTGSISISVTPSASCYFTISLRIPEWSASTNTTLNVNGDSNISVTPGSYKEISRTWHSGDVINLRLDMRGRYIEPLGAEPYGAIMHGPIVLAQDSRLSSVGSNLTIEKDENGYINLTSVTPSEPNIWMEFVIPPDSSHLCDYASAGNNFESSNTLSVWMPTTIFTGEKTIKCISDNWNARAEGGGDSNGDNIARSSTKDNLAKWELIPDGSYYRIKLSGTDFYLSGEGPAGPIPNGRNIHLWTWADSDLQRWELIPDGSYFRLRCIEDDIYFSGSGDDSNIHLWQWVGSDLQRWDIQDYTSHVDECEKDLALTPPMGWNSWNNFETEINEDLIIEMGNAMVSSGMKDAGYEYIIIDDGWATRNDQGQLEGIKMEDGENKFPHGIKWLADQIHDLGLKFGIYSSPNNTTCAGYEGSLGYECEDATQFAAWGVDYLKYDRCGVPYPIKDRFELMRDCLQATGRPIVYSINPAELYDVLPWARFVANLWRTTQDIKDFWGPEPPPPPNDWARSVLGIVDEQVTEMVAKYAGPGHWNDPDMLVVGLFSNNGDMNDLRYRSHFSLWSILAAPLIAGNDLRSMSNYTVETLTNLEVIAVNQDPAGLSGKRVWTGDNAEIWCKSLKDGSKAVALFNRGPVLKEITVYWEQIGLWPTLYADVRDLWQKENLGSYYNSFKIDVLPDQVVIVKITGTSLPGTWADTDVGETVIAGYSSYSASTDSFLIKASGADIWDESDGFHYVYQPMVGDGSIVARVVSVEQTHPWAKAGVMIRENLDHDAKHAMTVVTPVNGIAFQRRREAGAISYHTAGSDFEMPNWVRLVRKGNIFSAYESINGNLWELIGSDIIDMCSTIYIGMAVSSHNSDELCLAEIDNVVIAMLGDFDNDWDVDGFDLYIYSQGETGLSMEDFVRNFGRIH
ncbi:MAG: beta-L-arabinofuranosidase domain-containing protein, partial [Nitrospinales bacterium]